MLRFSIVFLLIALLAGALGFTTIAGSSYFAAQILFFVFLVLFIVSIVFNRRTPVDTV